MLQAMIRGFKRISGKYRKHNQRGKGIRLMGVKSLECCFNPITSTYNPHFHLVVANKEIAETVVNEWLALWTRKYTIHAAQNYQPVKNLGKALIEIIKYGSKIFTEPYVNDKANTRNSANIYTAALYNIFEAMKGLRIFERFGFDLPKDTKRERTGARVVNDYAKWVFVAKCYDWLNTENELTLSGFVPDTGLVNLLENDIDTINE